MNILLADFHRSVGAGSDIEKMLSEMAVALAERGHAVTAVFADEKEGEPFFPLPSGVKVYNLYRVPGKAKIYPSSLIKLLRAVLGTISLEAARDQNFRMIRKADRPAAEILRREKPDVIISFRGSACRLFYRYAETDVPVIAMLPDDPKEGIAGMPEEERHAFRDSARIHVTEESGIRALRQRLRGGRFAVISTADDNVWDKWDALIREVVEEKKGKEAGHKKRSGEKE